VPLAQNQERRRSPERKGGRGDSTAQLGVGKAKNEPEKALCPGGLPCLSLSRRKRYTRFSKKLRESHCWKGGTRGRANGGKGKKGGAQKRKKSITERAVFQKGYRLEGIKTLLGKIHLVPD